MYLTLMTLVIVMTGGGPLGSTTTLSFEASGGRAGRQHRTDGCGLDVVLVINVALGVVYTA